MWTAKALFRLLRSGTSLTTNHNHIIIRFSINMQVQGQHPHQWAPFQIPGLLHAWQISHQISRNVYHEGWWPRASTLCNPSLSAVSMSSWASQAYAFHQPVCQRLSWLHHWTIDCTNRIIIIGYFGINKYKTKAVMQVCRYAGGSKSVISQVLLLMWSKLEKKK